MTTMNHPSKTEPLPAFPRAMLALFFAVFPFGVGWALLFYLWLGSFDEFGPPPLFFRMMGSFIGLAFVLFGTVLIYGTLRASGLSSLRGQSVSEARGAAEGAAGSLVYECPRCGAPLASAADVSPSGDAKCHHCGAWFNARSQ
jgi:hypothetical protein